MWICDKMNNSPQTSIFTAKILTVSPEITAIGFGEIQSITPVNGLSLSVGNTAVIAFCEDKYYAVAKL
ncbi:MAG: hypothetical protein ACI4QV_03555 [Acutalibacteraceae bacterium]